MVVGAGVAAQVRGQRRGGIGGRDHQQPGLAHDGRSGGTAAAEHDVPMTPTTRASPTTVAAAAAPPSALQSESSPAPGDVVPLDWAVVGHSQRHAPLAGDTQVAGARQRAERANMDNIIGTDHDRSQGGALEIRRHTGAGEDEQQKQSAPDQQRETKAACRRHGFLLLGLAGCRSVVGNRDCGPVPGCVHGPIAS